MRTFELYTYSIPMVDGVYLSSQRLKSREGILIFLQDGNAQGRGEIAPLPLYSQEDLPTAYQAAHNWLTMWQQGQSPKESALPSVAFGISCALAELNQTLPLADQLPHIPNCVGDPDELLIELNQTSLAHVNIGLYESVRDGMIVNLLLETHPHLQLRLTGSQSWNPQKSAGFLKYLSPQRTSRIDYISDPCRTLAESIDFTQSAQLKLAIDLSHYPQPLPKQAHIDTLILKPTLIGSIERCRQMINTAQQNQQRVVIESSYESSLGLSQLAALAQIATSNTPAQLSTLSLMTAQIVQPIQHCALPLIEKAALTRQDGKKLK